MKTQQTRRRFLCLSASAVVAGPACAASGPQAQWQGRALGAAVSMTLAGLDQTEAAPVFTRIKAELRRLEKIFSLYQRDSELSRLNAAGHLRLPSPELLDVLAHSGSIHAATGGAFDPTVQPLWRARALGGAGTAAAVGWQHLRYGPAEVRFQRPGMGLTLNGIAQGYVTDRISAALHREGLQDVLVDMGEIAARGNSANGDPWQAGIASPDGRLLQRLSLRERALATSAASGTLLGDGSSHIVDPRNGQSAGLHRLISVSAPKAALADGLSTALCLLPAGMAPEVLARFPGARLEYSA